MEPGQETPRITPEQAPSLPSVSPEFIPGASPERTPEREAQPGERESTPQQPQTTAAPALPVPVADDTTQDDTADLLTAVPDVAADDDLIEKEWVDKAKRIITETSDDPHKREAAVSQLQREYLRKRYGKEIGVTE